MGFPENKIKVFGNLRTRTATYRQHLFIHPNYAPALNTPQKGSRAEGGYTDGQLLPQFIFSFFTCGQLLSRRETPLAQSHAPGKLLETASLGGGGPSSL
jgi:hypothetical protein